MSDPTHPITPQALRPMSRSRLLIVTVLAAVTGFVIVFGAIVPAEFGKDPTGLGKLGGLSRLWAPPEKKVKDAGSVAPAHEYPAAWRSDVIEIPLGGFLSGHEGSELEYKVRMKKDGTFIYAWSVEGAERPDDFHYDFHGHTTPPPGEQMTVAEYKVGYGIAKQGALTAPFEGIHGWQFSNSSEKPVVVKLRIAGFYELIPAGQPGNEANIVANVPAAQARPDFHPAAGK